MADEMKPTPRSPILGLFSDIVNLPLGYMSSPERTQQMQGVAQFLYGTGIPKTLERMSYGDSLFSGAGGLGGTTRMRPETAEAVMNVAPFAPAAGRLFGRAIRATEGMPIGMSIKPINLNKGIYKPELTMEEMLKVKDIPTVERVQKSIDLIGEKEFENMVNAQFKKYKPTNPETEAMLVESVTLDILGRAQRSPYPQQAALDLAQQRAALPVSEGGLGLPANNTPMDRAKAMGYTTEGYRGSTVSETTHQNPLWWSEDPQYASAYAAHTIRPPKGQPDPYAGNVMPVLVNIGKSKEFEKFSVGGVPTDPFSGFKDGIETGFRRYAKNEVTKDMGGKLWEALTVPQNVRSRFAAFDPFRKDVATATAMGVALPDLLAQPVNQYQQTYETTPMYTDPFGNTIGSSIR